MENLKATINQLLLDGADPRRVRCPQPALFMAIVAHAPNLIETLVKYGANVNEVYPQVSTIVSLNILLLIELFSLQRPRVSVIAVA